MMAFSGIQVIDPVIFQHAPEEERFSLIRLYLRLAKDHLITGFPDESRVWKDLGKSPGDLYT
jgi:NDP-sugar pyrophosphorylase family protein